MLDDPSRSLLIQTEILPLRSLRLRRLNLLEVLLHSCQLTKDRMLLCVDTIQS